MVAPLLKPRRFLPTLDPKQKILRENDKFFHLAWRERYHADKQMIFSDSM